jgi:hypothetical protein
VLRHEPGTVVHAVALPRAAGEDGSPGSLAPPVAAPPGAGAQPEERDDENAAAIARVWPPAAVPGREPPQHPYQGLPDTRFWNRAVSFAPPAGVDPVIRAPYRIDREHRVATMGSCFAQHLSRHLRRTGLTYFVAEEGPADRQFGVFSARYGNVYTVAQAVDLFRRAYGELVPGEGPWRRRDGRLVDPFRPVVEPEGFADEAALAADRAAHLAATRRVFEAADVFVFTMGLTEAWRSRADGCVLPAAPGSAGDPTGDATYEFVNFGVDQVRADLVELCERVRSVNPGVRVLLTVSPVPLIATFEDRHVLVSTVASKSILRAAADDVTRHLGFVDYFPAYEIISSATTDRDYFEPDRREVSDLGVAHVMRTFTRHYVAGRSGEEGEPVPVPVAAVTQSQDVICDEETILGALDASRGAGLERP